MIWLLVAQRLLALAFARGGALRAWGGGAGCVRPRGSQWIDTSSSGIYRGFQMGGTRRLHFGHKKLTKGRNELQEIQPFHEYPFALKWLKVSSRFALQSATLASQIPCYIFDLIWGGNIPMSCDCSSCIPSLRGNRPFYRWRSMNWSTSECRFLVNCSYLSERSTVSRALPSPLISAVRSLILFSRLFCSCSNS